MQGARCGRELGGGTDIPRITCALAHDWPLPLNLHLLHFLFPMYSIRFILFKLCFVHFVFAAIGFGNHMICLVKIPRWPQSMED